MARRPRDAEATRKNILDKAQELFVRQGFGSTSLAQIGTACSCANSLILHHFQSKEGLWHAVKDRVFEGFVEDRRDIFSAASVSVEELRNTITAYFRFLQKSPEVVLLLLRAEMERDLAWNQINRQQLAPFVERMEQAQQAGILRGDINASHLLVIVINAITRWFEARHMFGDWLGPADADSDEAYLESVLQVLFEGALSPAARGVAP